MIDYFEQLSQEEQEDITEVIQILYRQTFLLERKYDKKSGRMQYVREYRICSKHMEFLRAYYKSRGNYLERECPYGPDLYPGGGFVGREAAKLATIYLLVLKLIYDEQMAAVSSSSHIVTTLGAVNGKAGDFRVLHGLPSPTEMRRTIALLKKYQIIEPLDVLEELNEHTRLIIYPCIHAVLMGDDIKELLETLVEEENIGDEAAIQSTLEDMPE